MDPITQTCVGKNERDYNIKTSFFIYILINFVEDVDECEQDIDECRQVLIDYFNSTKFLLFRPGYICKNVPGTYK